jgi:hypothetical protein
MRDLSTIIAISVESHHGNYLHHWVVRAFQKSEYDRVERLTLLGEAMG